ncbi:hypothetical protein L226DRAFT_510774 [Lentinus tigrinus ALCF2SS1-7]|uniref:Uncharacterized protein n=1 Tax=Lentinus tigrinus ALCF2SS1-6 TaxID=1328759 RepID=A0A5C2S5M5_9APHY|nr:hypothetical protein L227DRAFT_528111 [Lentinus tigrinus ALCF2SS1-6]RPD73346.1 hypothetical protein L226DRAFT_510774 [Lentinus tigrinus ALCF2SS1-7]
MSLPTERLTISHANALPSVTPNLMPFHIAYSGPAPISTYFRVKPSSSPTYGRDVRSPQPLSASGSQQLQDSQATLVGSVEESSSSTTTLSRASTTVGADTPTEQGTVDAVCDDSRHYVASFRGREMHGMAVDLPEGYTGIVLRAPDGGKGKGVASGNRTREEEKPAPKGRTTRRSKRAQEEIKVEDEEMDASSVPEPGSDEGPTRVLEPVSTFSTFVLWNPDIPPNEGRDEYVRSLTEWTRLAAEIHRMEDC